MAEAEHELSIGSSKPTVGFHPEELEAVFKDIQSHSTFSSITAAKM